MKHHDYNSYKNDAFCDLFTERPSMGQIVLVILILMAALFSQPAHSVPKHLLWYDHPAMTWTQALPIGNGTMGGMVYGTPAVERIQLNEETIWAGQPNRVCHPEAKKYLPIVRQLIFEGKYKEADQLANEKVMPLGAGQNCGMPYQPFGASIFLLYLDAFRQVSKYY